MGLVGASFIPIPNSVSGKATIAAAPGTKQPITLPEDAVVERVYARQNKEVGRGQILVQLSSDELDEKLAELDKQLQQSQSSYTLALQQLNAASARRDGVLFEAKNLERRAGELRQELSDVENGNLSPALLSLQQRQIEAEKELESLQNLLNLRNSEFARYQGLVEQGALAPTKLDEPQYKIEDLKGQIEAKKAEIASLGSQIKAEQKTMQDEFKVRRDTAEERNWAVRSSEQEVKIAAAEVAKWREQIPLLQAEREELMQRQQRLEIDAPMSGTIITEDPQQWEGQKLAAGKQILELVDSNRLEAIVEIRQEDAEQIKQGMPVRFRPPGVNFRESEAIVEDVLPPDSSDMSQQKPLVRVRISVKDTDVRLMLGTQGNAHIRAGEIPVYQKMKQEALKLLNLGKYI